MYGNGDPMGGLKYGPGSSAYCLSPVQGIGMEDTSGSSGITELERAFGGADRGNQFLNNDSKSDKSSTGDCRIDDDGSSSENSDIDCEHVDDT